MKGEYGAKLRKAGKPKELWKSAEGAPEGHKRSGALESHNNGGRSKTKEIRNYLIWRGLSNVETHGAMNRRSSARATNTIRKYEISRLFGNTTIPPDRTSGNGINGIPNQEYTRIVSKRFVLEEYATLLKNNLLVYQRNYEYPEYGSEKDLILLRSATKDIQSKDANPENLFLR